MKRYAKVVVPALMASFATLSAQAGQLDIQFNDAKEFRDVRAGNSMSQRRFEERVVKDLRAYFQEDAARFLPAGQTLQVSIQDVDLAGEVEYFHRGFEQGLRVIRGVDFPRLEFSYVLLDDSGEVIQDDYVKIKDMSFQFGNLDRGLLRDEPFYYEKKLIDQWFHDTFFDPDLS